MTAATTSGTVAKGDCAASFAAAAGSAGHNGNVANRSHVAQHLQQQQQHAAHEATAVPWRSRTGPYGGRSRTPAAATVPLPCTGLHRPRTTVRPGVASDVLYGPCDGSSGGGDGSGVRRPRSDSPASLAVAKTGRERLPSVNHVDGTVLSSHSPARDGEKSPSCGSGSSPASPTTSTTSSSSSPADDPQMHVVDWTAKSPASSPTSVPTSPSTSSAPAAANPVPQLSFHHSILLQRQALRKSNRPVAGRANSSILVPRHRLRPVALPTSHAHAHPNKQRNSSWSSANGTNSSTADSSNSYHSHRSTLSFAGASAAAPTAVQYAIPTDNTRDLDHHHNGHNQNNDPVIDDELGSPDEAQLHGSIGKDTTDKRTLHGVNRRSQFVAAAALVDTLTGRTNLASHIDDFLSSWTTPLADVRGDPVRNIVRLLTPSAHTLGVLATVLLCALGLRYYQLSHATLSQTITQMESLLSQRRSLHAKLQSTELDLHQLQSKFREVGSVVPFVDNPTANGRQLSSSSPSLSQTHQSPNNQPDQLEMEQLKLKLERGTFKIDVLQQNIQRTCRHDVLDKYGPGPYRVELELDFPKPKNAIRNQNSAGTPTQQQKQPTKIVMELASIDLMPHSVFMFLEMVTSGLIDGCSFIFHAMNVVKAAPLPYDGSSASAKVKAFATAGLESVAFREYSAEFPHEQYTVGFAVEGSPSFYINTQDNTDLHAGDPCFAKVIRGYDTIQRLEQAPTRNGIYYRQRIGIKQARLMAEFEP